MARKYGKKAQKKVGKAMHEFKEGKLKSGKSGKTVKSKKQAIAIGLSEARKEGAKVPNPPKKTRAKTTAAKKKKTVTRKKTTKTRVKAKKSTRRTRSKTTRARAA